jgi:tetratricopeptide (TPR) repeat protein
MPPIPAIPLAQLEAASARLIQQHLEAVKLAPRSGAAWGRLGGVLRCYEFRDEAQRCLDVAERLDPTEPRWPYLRALLASGRDSAAAEALLRRTVSLCGNDPEAPRLRLARALAESGDWAGAERELNELTQTRPDNTPALLQLAFAAQAQGRVTNAIALAKRCTTSAYTASAAWRLLAALHLRLGETNAAQFAMLKGAAIAADVPVPDPFEAEFQVLRGDARSLSDRAQQALMAGKPAEADDFIQRLIKEHPTFPETWLLLGRQKFLLRQPLAAEQALRRHLEMDAKSINGHFQLGMALLAQDRYVDAADAFEKTTRLRANLGPAHFNLGFARVKAGRKLEAVEPFREAIRHNPEYIDSYILLADLLVQLGKRGEAAELAQRAQALNPDDRRLPTLRERLAPR